MSEHEGGFDSVDRRKSRRAAGAEMRSAGGSGPFRGIGCSLLGLAAAALIIALAATGVMNQALPFIQGEWFGGAKARSRYRLLNNARQLVAALKTAAHDNEGRYPLSLRLLAPSVLSETELNRLLLEGSEGSPTGEAWIYLPDPPDDGPANPPLIIAAAAGKDGRRMAGFHDGSVAEISSAEAERLMKPQP